MLSDTIRTVKDAEEKAAARVAAARQAAKADIAAATAAAADAETAAAEAAHAAKAAAAKAARTAYSQQAGKAHLHASGTRGQGGVQVPQDVAYWYRQFQPEMTDEEIRKDYAARTRGKN